MTFNSTIERILELDKAVAAGWEVDGKVVHNTVGTWIDTQGPKTAALIAEYRTLCPKAARALKIAVDIIAARCQMTCWGKCDPPCDYRVALAAIAKELGDAP